MDEYFGDAVPIGAWCKAGHCVPYRARSGKRDMDVIDTQRAARKRCARCLAGDVPRYPYTHVICAFWHERSVTTTNCSRCNYRRLRERTTPKQEVA